MIDKIQLDKSSLKIINFIKIIKKAVPFEDTALPLTKIQPVN